MPIPAPGFFDCIANARKRIKSNELCYRRKGRFRSRLGMSERSRSRMRRSLRVSPAVVLGCISFFAISSRLYPQTSGGTPSVTLPGSQSPFQGSAPEGVATPEVLQIDFKEAVERGLRNNLGLLLAGDQAQAARGQRWQQLADLLPNISIRATEDVQ